MSMVELTDTERRLDASLNRGVAGDLTVSESAGGVLFSNASQVMEFAKMMALSQIGVRKHLRGNPGACLAVCVQAIEWGLSPYAVANKSYLVNDQLAFESQMIQAVILKRAPIKGRFKVEFKGDGDKRVCRIWAELKEPAGEIVEYVSPEFAKITPKNSPLWKTDPDQQHYYYSGRALCRRHFPDVLLGVYAEDELLPAGPAGARDVTPPRSLNEKLDALAHEPAHDPETGEIADAAGGVLDERSAAASSAEDAKSHEPFDDPGAPTELDPVAVARERGAADFRNGVQRRAVPPEYRDASRTVERNAWLHGWDEADADAAAEAGR